MKWFILVIMFNAPTTVGTDIFAFTTYPFPDEWSCRGFLKKNKQLAINLASQEYDGRPVKSVVCIDEVQLLEVINDGEEV